MQTDGDEENALPGGAPEPDLDEGGERDVDATGLVAVARPRLGDYLSGQPELPFVILVVVAGPCRGRVVIIDGLPSVVGRSDDADITVDDDTVSRRHARFDGDRDHVEVEDLGSSNGTTLNGNAIVGRIGLLDGDIVGFGDAVMVVKVLR